MAGAKKKAKSAKSGKSRNAKSALSRETLETYYREMLTIRRFEEKAGQMYGMGLIGGFCHLYIGQEAVVTGIQHALGPGDTVITGYRCHAHMLAAGAHAKSVMAELTGRAGGVSKGKGGSMHMFAPDGGFFGGHGIVGAQAPLGAGIGFAHKYRGNDRVSVTYFGDGAANQGQVFEAFNMAALWRLPVIFVIENNQYAMGTSVARSTAVQELCQRGEAFGIPGQQADGMDVLAVREAAEAAVAKCRVGEGPALLEMMTYRYRGHSMSDPAKYRTREEVSKMRQERDPIEHVGEMMISAGHVNDEALKEIDRQVKAAVNDAAEFAQNNQEPDAGELYTDIVAAG
ncbi:MAG: pyruvate dehydrogenase (acetyl-transferring) E1 component subunit alpha [Rhodospirillaceae bacterium]|nr:pyruvate dehydrogenase (acetyl-transferring) E1 component subunit alpha [Rhodospirillaceae bacterium]